MHEHEEQRHQAAEPEEAPVQAEAAVKEPVEQDLDELLTTAQAERDEYLALAQRTQADFENYRKRMSREVGVPAAQCSRPRHSAVAYQECGKRLRPQEEVLFLGRPRVARLEYTDLS